MNDRYTTARTPYARAAGAPSVMAGTYTGAELGRTCLRPGAYEAMALPSLFNGIKREPAPAMHAAAGLPPTGGLQITTRARVAISDAEHAIAPPPPITPCALGKQGRHVKPRGDYQPRKGSAAARAIDALNAMPQDARLSIAEIRDRFGLPGKQFQAAFRLAFEHRLLIFFVDAETRQRVVALPTSKAADPSNGARLLSPSQPEPHELTDAA